MELDWEKILLILLVIGYLNDVFELTDHIIDLVKAVVKGVKWISGKIQNARK